MIISALEKLRKISKKFPASPGVYFFLNKNKKPIYIGRAGSLKRRITSYFRAADFRIKEMVESAKGLKFQKTKTLLEAIILEANLIKKYWPKYNIVDRDDSTFSYLIILKGSYPKVLIVRESDIKKYGMGKAKIFGPYQSQRLLRIALNLVRRIFPFSYCAPNQGKPCFDYQIGLCPGICVGKITPAEYRKNIDNLIMFFWRSKKTTFEKNKKAKSGENYCFGTG